MKIDDLIKKSKESVRKYYKELKEKENKEC